MTHEKGLKIGNVRIPTTTFSASYIIVVGIGGHYIAYIKEDTKWICYNDSSVSMVSDTDAAAIAKKAYVFFHDFNGPE